jgi:hypothetical protein
MALRTFIPLACCFWNTATPLCTKGATAPALRVGRALERMACERHRVCIAGSVVVIVGWAARERARIDEVSDLAADAADRVVFDKAVKLAIAVSLSR